MIGIVGLFLSSLGLLFAVLGFGYAAFSLIVGEWDLDAATTTAWFVGIGTVLVVVGVLILAFLR